MPSAPKSFAVKDITAQAVTLRWSPPEDNGGSNITGYVLEKREGHRRMWQTLSTVEESEMTVSGLYTGNQYSFRVYAENEVGPGEPVELQDLVVPKSKFGKIQSFWI